MFGVISAGSNALALLQTRLAFSRAKMAASSTPTANASTTEAEKAAAEKVRRAQDALDALKQANATRKQQRKAAAREKIERLKKQLEALRLASGVGDPKAVARRAKQIARELAAAAKEYAAAGGGGGGVASPVSADGAAVQTQATGAEAQGGGDEGASGDGANDQAASGGGAEVKDGGATETKANATKANATEAEAPVAHADSRDQKTAAQPVAPSAEEERLAKVEAFQKIAGDMLDKSTEAVADSKFAAEVRRLFQQVKAIMELQRHRAKMQETDDEEMDRLSKQIADIGADIEASLTGGDATEVIVPVNLQV